MRRDRVCELPTRTRPCSQAAARRFRGLVDVQRTSSGREALRPLGLTSPQMLAERHLARVTSDDLA